MITAHTTTTYITDEGTEHKTYEDAIAFDILLNIGGNQWGGEYEDIVTSFMKEILERPEVIGKLSDYSAYRYDSDINNKLGKKGKGYDSTEEKAMRWHNAK